MKVFVGNLAESIDAEDLRKVFLEFGAILDIEVETLDNSDRTRRYANISLESDDAARAAILELNLAPLKGRPVRVREHLRREHERRNQHVRWAGRERRRRLERRNG